MHSEFESLTVDLLSKGGKNMHSEFESLTVDLLSKGGGGFSLDCRLQGFNTILYTRPNLFSLYFQIPGSPEILYNTYN